MTLKICGILNVTPDSFSDGGVFYEKKSALDQGKKLFDEGADLIDIGGDSTRPGSVCVGVEEEWRRIGEIIGPLSKLGTVSVDTHHSEIARRALQEGASIINNVFPNNNADLSREVALQKGVVVLMASRCLVPHNFEGRLNPPILESIILQLNKFIKEARNQGVSSESIWIDPGMGGFISSDAADSLLILDNLKTFFKFGVPVMLGVSRKGFIKVLNNSISKDIDTLSVELAKRAIDSLPDNSNLILRVHNVDLHNKILKKTK